MIRPAIEPDHRCNSSYGASIAGRPATNHPELVDRLVLTGPAICPGRETGIISFIEHWSVHWFIPRIFHPANTEKVHHKKNWEKMRS